MRLTRPCCSTTALGGAILLSLACSRPRTESPVPYSPPPVKRHITLLTGPWTFIRSQNLTGAEATTFDDRSWSQVSVPHTWGKEPLRSAWYRTSFHVAPGNPGGRVYISFEGVATFADVYVNGAHLGAHRGAFTRFVFDATDHVIPGDNLLAVRVTNDPKDTADSLPSGLGKQLYHLYGGIYRKVWLITTPAEHIDPTDHASSGVFVTATGVGAAGADLSVRVRVRNAGTSQKAFTVRSHLCDASGERVATFEGTLLLEPGARGETTVGGVVRRPHLWSPARPTLYTLWTELVADGKTVDLVRERTGFRDFRLRENTFFLNGAPLALRGIAKHQENEDRASALTDEDIREDFAVLKELGVNFVRLAHYPHAPLAYDLADELGLLVWAENGNSNAHKGDTTGETITREMVRQNYNHPSIVMWSVGNESAFVRVNRYAPVVKSDDPHRLVTYASNTGSRGKRRYPHLDFIAQNTYRGWYRGLPWEFEDRAREMRFVSEAGAGAVITHHTDDAGTYHVVDVFEPEEYRQKIAEAQFQVVFRDRPTEIPLYTVWLLRDFATDKYKGRNTKGLLTYAGFKKDTYYLYMAFLRPETPVVHIASKTYFLRQGRNGVKAYSNRPALTLVVNGESQGIRRNGEYLHENGRVVSNVFHWPMALKPGRNEIRVADDEGHADQAVIDTHPEGRTIVPEAGAGGGDLLRDLRSSNSRSPAYWIEQPAKDQWPFYYEFDGNADNTWGKIPPPLAGASWISTRRLSRPENRTTLSFTVTRSTDVFVVATSAQRLSTTLTQAGFRPIDTECRWRDHELALAACRIHEKEARAGDRVTVPAATADYVVLVKERVTKP